MSLLSKADPAPVVENGIKDSSSFVFVCDHADRIVPLRLGRLGLEDPQWDKHIAYDIGIYPVARMFCEKFSAPLICQIYSRLVIDCNRRPDSPASIPEISDHVRIPGNCNLHKSDRENRLKEIFYPYHQKIKHLLDRREQQGIPTILVALHSFTPRMDGFDRPWPIGFIGSDSRDMVEKAIQRTKDLNLVPVGDNEPYGLNMIDDMTLSAHGVSRNIPSFGIEIRQDLIATPEGQAQWANHLYEIFSDLTN